MTQIGNVLVMDWLSRHLLSPLWPSFVLQLWSGLVCAATEVRDYTVKCLEHILNEYDTNNPDNKTHAGDAGNRMQEIHASVTFRYTF